MLENKIDSDKLNSMSENEIAALINYHNKRYWEDGEPEISEIDYDLLMRRLEELNPEHPLVFAVSAPTVASSGKVRHAKPMLSLNKAYSLEDLIEWAEKYVRRSDEPLLVEPKYDGISANFSNGILATRGDGEEGENISDKLPLIELESKGRKGPVNRPVRGEIIIRNDDFKERYSHIKKKDGKLYKNSRNAVAGIMGLKDIGEMQRQNAKLTLVDYEMISYQVKYKDLKERWPELLEEIEALPYPMDGIVVKLADAEYSESLGNTAHHPRGQIAFKFSGVRKQTKLLGVEWSFGKNCLTPVAQLEPVEIGGITIKRATLHNAQNIIDKDVKIGDTVTVERAGDVIPYIVEAEPGENRKECLIAECPCCGSELLREGPELCCKNQDCVETKLQRLLAAVKNIGIDRLGEPNIRRMMEKLGVKNLKDIFNLKFDDIVTLEGFKDKSANNLIREIKSAKSARDYQLLAALNISNIGPNVAKSILAEYTLGELRELDKDQLSEINGIGPERAGAIERELKRQSDFLDEMLECLEVSQTKGEPSSLPTICFTGKMPEKRSYYEEIAKERGYEPSDAVTSSLSLLVAVDMSGASSKLNKARNAGVKVMSLEEWLSSPPEETAAPQKKEPENAEAAPPKVEEDFGDLPLFNF